MPGVELFNNHNIRVGGSIPRFNLEAPADGNPIPPSEPRMASSLDVVGIVFFPRLGHQLNLRKIGVVKLLVQSR
jgi:hypothetical protein